MKPKRYPYSGNKKESIVKTTIDSKVISEIMQNKILSASEIATGQISNQFFNQVVGDTKISINNNGVELEAPQIIV